MYPLNCFPYSNFHDINLSWMIAKLKELENRIETWEKKLSSLEVALNKEIADRKAADDDLQQQITNNYNTLNTSIQALTWLHQEDVYKLKGEINRAYLKANAYTDYQIELVKKLINPPIPSPTFNYFQQKITKLQCTLRDYYLHLRDHAYTAGEFDQLGLTAGELDGLGLTAGEYDLEGLHKIKDFKKDWPWFDYDPYTGEKVELKRLIRNLYQYHMGGLTCGEWDAMEYTCGEFDQAGYTAYQLDWTQDPKELDKKGGVIYGYRDYALPGFATVEV